MRPKLRHGQPAWRRRIRDPAVGARACTGCGRRRAKDRRRSRPAPAARRSRTAHHGEHRDQHLPWDGHDAETLLTRADMALYHAKDQGRDGYQFYKPDLNARAVKRQLIEAGLHRALDKQEFELLYQPKMNLKTGGLVGAEALIRWRHPEFGLVEPAEFISIADECWCHQTYRSLGRLRGLSASTGVAGCRPSADSGGRQRFCRRVSEPGLSGKYSRHLAEDRLGPALS